jgi:hypothetical protein
MISVLADHHAAQQPGPRQALGDRLIGDRSDDDLFFAATASILPASMLDYFQNCRHEFQLLARLAADSLSRLTAAWTQLFNFGKIVVHNFARQVIGQPSAAAASTTVFTDCKRGGVFWSHGGN